MLSTLHNMLYILAIKAAYDVGRHVLRQKPLKLTPFALVAVAAVAVPSLLQIIWPQIYDWLSCRPDLIVHQAQYWRVLTAVTVQNGGLIGTAFNLIALVFIALVAGPVWGWRRATLIFVGAGIALNLLCVAFDVTDAGNSGANFVLAASLVGYYWVRDRPLTRRWVGEALGCLAIGTVLVAWHDAHGGTILAGAVVGGLLGHPLAGRRSQT